MKAYPHFPSRKSQLLDGTWDFAWLGDSAKLGKIKPGKIEYNDIMAVPGCFDTFTAEPGRRGVAVYRKKVDWEAGKDLRLRIGGMGLAAKIWWDGKPVGDYRLPYSSVNYDFNSGKGEEHELVIAIDNRFDPVLSPLFSPNFDFYAFGGIYRSVELQELPKTYIERVQITTKSIKTGEVTLRIIVGGKVPDELKFSMAFDKNAPKEFTKKVVNGEIALKAKVPNHKVWSLESPNLHKLTVCTDSDKITERFGVRTVTTKGQKILVNGKAVRLIGFNRHESHPELGPVQNHHLILEDLHLLRDMGCNFIRCVHYPQDQAFFDICDEFGILTWHESLGWGNKEEEATNPDFFDLQVKQTELMVKNSINHPSIILWGFLNECCSETEGGKPLYKALAETIRSVEPSLLVTYASSKCEQDICFEYADVIAMNIYPGWIHTSDWLTPPSKMIAEGVEQKAKHACLPDLKNKPFIMSEIGACGIYGEHDRATAQWSEEAQAEYFAEATRCVLGNKRYAGLALWQMVDTKSFVNAGGVRSKPFGFNLAGVVDPYRRPKKVYDVMKEVFKEFTK